MERGCSKKPWECPTMTPAPCLSSQHSKKAQRPSQCFWFVLFSFCNFWRTFFLPSPAVRHTFLCKLHTHTHIHTHVCPTINTATTTTTTKQGSRHSKAGKSRLSTPSLASQHPRTPHSVKRVYEVTAEAPFLSQKDDGNRPGGTLFYDSQGPHECSVSLSHTHANPCRIPLPH